MKRQVRRTLEIWGLRLTSVVIAIVLWAIVLSSRAVEVTKEVPISLVTPPGLIASNEVPDHVLFRLSGPKAFLRAILDRREDPIEVFFQSDQPGVRSYQFYSNQIRLPSGVQVINFQPTSIVVKLERLKKKDVPLRVELRSNFPTGFHLSRMEIVPPIVRIKGAETRIDGIEEVHALPVDVSALTQTEDRPLTVEWTRLGIQYDGVAPVLRLTIKKVRGD